MAYNTAAYVWEAGGFGELQNHIADIQASGLTTVILAHGNISKDESRGPYVQ